MAEIYSLQFSGFFTWMLWRATYLFKLPTLSMKIGVALDWLVAAVFPPPIARLHIEQPISARRSHFAMGDLVYESGQNGGELLLLESGSAGVYLQDGTRVATMEKGDPLDAVRLNELSALYFEALSVKAESSLDAITWNASALAELSKSEGSLYRNWKQSMDARISLGYLLSGRSNSILAGVTVAEVMRPGLDSFIEDCVPRDVLPYFGDQQSGRWIMDARHQLVGYLGRTELYSAMTYQSADKRLSEIARTDIKPLRPEQDLPSATLETFRSGVNALPVVAESGTIIGLFDPIFLASRDSNFAALQHQSAALEEHTIQKVPQTR